MKQIFEELEIFELQRSHSKIGCGWYIHQINFSEVALQNRVRMVYSSKFKKFGDLSQIDPNFRSKNQKQSKNFKPSLKYSWGTSCVEILAVHFEIWDADQQSTRSPVAARWCIFSSAELFDWQNRWQLQQKKYAKAHEFQNLNFFVVLEVLRRCLRVDKK